MRNNSISLFGILLWLFIFPAASRLHSQSIRNFTNEPVKFAQEMQGFLEETDRKAAEKIMEDFLLAWNGGKFTASQQEAIYKTCNSMLRKRMKGFPDFRNYLVTLTSFANSNQTQESFSSWQASLDKLLLMPAKYFANYIITCNLLFRDNTLYESASTRWYSSAGNYRFEFDSVPKITFPSLDLICTAKGDSSVISSTKGTYYATSYLFAGSGGKVNWSRAGWDPNAVRADLANYRIDVTGSDFTMDSVTFFNTTYFKQPLTGKYTDKILANVTTETATYPRFESYSTELEIKNLVPDFDYRGGFSMVGNKMVGSGTREQNAELTLRRNGKLFFKAESKGFIIRKDRLTSDKVSVTFFFEKDSVYHPGVTFKYIVNDREIALIRGEEGKSDAPYMDSFHQVDMFFDGLYWKIDEPTIDLKMISGSGEGQAYFESANYFRKNRFVQLQGLSEVHPLYSIKQFCEKNSTRTVYTEDLAKDMRMPPSEIRTMLIHFSNYGFVVYDSQDDKAIVKDRLYYYLQANVGKIDYDVLRFESTIKARANASINLLNYEMTLRGLAPIVLSDSQNVVIFPKDQEIKLRKNRDFDFAGRLKAGRFDFYGKQFNFDYQNFKINMDNVDSLRLKVESDDPSDVDNFGNRKLVGVRSVLENITGDLVIDNFINKSGLKDYPMYPIFNSKKDSYVYYDRPFIQEGVYSRDNFFFHLDPFTIDSLDNFSRAGLKFGGELVSASIFPDFRDTLKLQPDLSLGLVRETGPDGWPAYGGKGKFTNRVSLSNEGLYGKGTVDYLTSVSSSSAFLFLPDSMNASVDKFVNRKEILSGVEFPSVVGDTVYVHWEPKRDVMYVHRKLKDIAMYDDQVKMKGDLQLRPTGMTGDGLMQFVTSELESQLFRYKSDVFDADTAGFRLNSDDAAALAFSTNNVNAHIDFKNRVGEFKSNGGGTYVNFPLNQYICFIDQFKWFMDEKELELSSSQSAQQVSDTASSGISLSGSEFVSVEARQDSLRFKAPFARYSLKDFLIKAEKVALIQTADAYVIPDSGKVVVERYAKMRTLNDARIIANTTTKYHSIYNATVDILGRKNYQASGDYDYIDENNIKHHFHFDNIKADTAYQTVASGELSDPEGFPLSPNFLFKGTVNLAASRQYLNFSGYSKPNIRCEKIEQNWIRFSGDINPSNVSIPVNSPVTDNGTKLTAAVAQTSDSTGIYAAFLMPKQKASDLEIINASGVLYFDKATGQFRITTAERLEKPGAAGNFLSLDDKKCLVYGEGKLDFGSDFGQVELKTIGNVTNNLNNDSTRFDVVAAINFPMDNDVLKIMGDQLALNPLLQPTQDIGRPVFERALTELAGKEKADKLIAELNLYGSFKKIPDELKYSFFLTDVKMAWDNGTRTYRSNGMIGIGSVDKTSVNRKMNGYVEVVHKRSGDVLNIYLEPENGTWYYFSYARGLMQTLSSNSAYNDAINKIKPEKRVSQAKDKPDFEYMITTDRSVKNFLKRMQPPPPDEETR